MKTTLEDVQRLRLIAKEYRLLVLVLLGSWMSGCCVAQIPSSSSQHASSGLQFLVLIALGTAVAVCGFRVARALGSSAPALWALAAMAPLVNLVVLLVLSRMSTAECKRHNVSVGFLGPNLRDLDQLEQLIVAPPPGYSNVL